MKTKLYASLAVSALALAFAGNAAASTINTGPSDCTNFDPDISEKVSPITACQILQPLDGQENDSVGGDPSGWIVNVEEFFGFEDWSFDGKFDDIGKNDQVDGSQYFTFSGDEQSGSFTWAGDSVAQDYDFMFVFKDGGSTNLVAYRIDMENLLARTATNGLAAQTGTYDTPFLFPPFVQQDGDVTQKDISHISVYYRENGFENGQIIPEPATLGLLGIGLFGLGMASYRRRRLASTEV